MRTNEIQQIAFLGLVLFFSMGCKKDDGTMEEPPGEEPTAVIYPFATDFTVTNNGTGGLNFIQMGYQRTNYSTFEVNATGTYSISIHGKNGRSILGAIMGQSSNMATYRVAENGGDTLRFVNTETGEKTDVLTDAWDGINAQIAFTSPANTPEATSRAAFNEFIASLKEKKFKRILFR